MTSLHRANTVFRVLLACNVVLTAYWVVTQFTGHSSISKSIHQPGAYSSGIPAMPALQWKKFFANLNHIWTEYPIEIANRIVRGLYPETAAAVAKTEEILETELPGALHRVLLECKDQVQRQLAAQEFNNSAS